MLADVGLGVFTASMGFHGSGMLRFLQVTARHARRPYRQGDHEEDQQCH